MKVLGLLLEKYVQKVFLNEYGKLPNLIRAGTPKKFLKGVYQLLFEFINKVVFPRSEKRTVDFGADLFMIEALNKFEVINLPAIILEHIHKISLLKMESMDGLWISSNKGVHLLWYSSWYWCEGDPAKKVYSGHSYQV